MTHSTQVLQSATAPAGSSRKLAILVILGVGALAMADLALLIAGVLPWSIPAATISLGLLVSASMAIGYDLARTSLPRPTAGNEMRGLAHDLRAPLTTTRTLLELVESGSMGKLSREACDALGRASLAAERVETLLERSLSDDTSDLSHSADLEAALARAMHALHTRIVDSSAVIGHGTLPVVAADPADMERVLTNLLLNSITHARPGEAPRIRVEAAREGSHWVISVIDNGPGIPSALRERAFEPGVRGRTAAPSPGFGLGLSTVRRLVEQHGGRAWIDPASGQGTSVQLELRAA